MNKYNLYNTDYQLLFPENLKKYKNLHTFSLLIEKKIKEDIISQLAKLSILKNIELQSDEVLTELSNQYLIDNWQETFDRQIKIELIRNAYWAHSKKGTKKIIVENLKKLKYPIFLKEWFEYGGKPFTFKIITTKLNTDINWIDDLNYIIDKYKNCRSILNTVEIIREKEIKNLKVSTFKTQEIFKEFIGIHNDICKKNNIYINSFRIMEVTKNV